MVVYPFELYVLHEFCNGGLELKKLCWIFFLILTHEIFNFKPKIIRGAVDMEPLLIDN